MTIKGIFRVVTLVLSSLSAIGQQCTEILLTKSDTIFINPDKVARPEEGHELYFGWISNKLDQKLKSVDGNQMKQVFVSFIVDEVGRLSDFEIEKGVGNPYDREAVRLIKKHPHKWIPGQCNDKNVKSKVFWFVKF